jgi:predicted ATPase
LTIFTGANSSGKSTVLQSILLITQTLQDPISSRSIVLNGGIKKFGSYDDIVNNKDISKNIKFGFEISPAEDFIDDLNIGAVRLFQLESTKCSFEISSDGIPYNLQPSLVETKLERIREKDSSIRIVKSDEHSEEEQKVIDKYSNRIPPTALKYKIENKIHVDPFFRIRTTGKHLGTSLRHFLPEFTFYYHTYNDTIKKYVEETLLPKNKYYIEDDIKKEKTKINRAIKKEFQKIAGEIRIDYKKHNIEDEYNTLTINNPSLRDIRTLFTKLNVTDSQKYITRLKDRVATEFEDKPILEDPVPIFFMSSSINTVQEYFGSNIKYLGPLREEPKALYPLANGLSSTDVGLKGENTAAVFENNKDKIVSYIDPANIENTDCQTLKKQKDTLKVVIAKWLKYLGVANDIITNDKGKFGHELNIETEGNKIKQDLTHVGVGVSQVLPILVMSLLAKKGDVLIMEQPELHLHPKVQTRLADFFITMNALKKQCLIETHSEYLINRLRYFVAISDDSKIANETMIYFVEKDKQTGCSKYRKVTINKYGVIEDWPDGFFDESECIASEILKAGMEKRRKEEYDDYEEE